jgi:hypothetical protein
MQGTVSKYRVALKRKQRKWLQRVGEATNAQSLVGDSGEGHPAGSGTSEHQGHLPVALPGSAGRPMLVQAIPRRGSACLGRPTPFRPRSGDRAKGLAESHDRCGSAADEVRPRIFSLEPSRAFLVSPEALRLESQPLVAESILAVDGAQAAPHQHEEGRDAKAWLAAHPRVSFIFTPFHGSSLNQVEIWFSILTSKCLKNRAFNNVEELATAVCRFADHWNDDTAHAFEWTYTGKVLHA